MNRPASEQLDTLEQRARAFGYRGDLLPYCQFFATPRTLKVLREIVDTEYDLRAQMRDWLALRAQRHRLGGPGRPAAPLGDPADQAGRADRTGQVQRPARLAPTASAIPDAASD